MFKISFPTPKSKQCSPFEVLLFKLSNLISLRWIWGDMVVQGFPPLFSLWITGCLFTRCSIINDNQLMSLPYLKLSMTLHAARRGPRFLVSVCKVVHELCLKIPALTPHHSVLQNMDQALYYFGHSLVLFLLPSKSIFFWSQLILLVVG